MARGSSGSAGIRPNLFIVGSPKCGTTSLLRYLEQHPEVFMSEVKEPNHFGSDVREENGVKDRDAYLGLFSAAGEARAIGEASVQYLASSDAAAEIAAFQPEARIIILLRDPVRQMRSLHNHNLARGYETYQDLGRALEANASGQRRRRLGDAPDQPQRLDYRRIASFADHLERYFLAFPREQIHVALTEDLGADTEGVYARVLAFLGVDATFKPEFTRVNEARRTRSRTISRLLFAPPRPVKRLAARILPLTMRKRWHQYIRRPLFHALSVVEPPAQIDAELARQLRVEFQPQVERVAALLGRPEIMSLWGYGVARTVDSA